jgi:hypothetical protein
MIRSCERDGVHSTKPQGRCQDQAKGEHRTLGWAGVELCAGSAKAIMRLRLTPSAKAGGLRFRVCDTGESASAGNHSRCWVLRHMGHTHAL